MPRRKSLRKYIHHAARLGAIDAKEIRAETVVTAAWVRLKCQYGCGGYGNCLTCPPHSPTPEETVRVLAGYTRAILIHGQDYGDVSEMGLQVEREAFFDGYYKAFSYGSGPCRLCDECNVEVGECRHPGEARPAMEASGIDVFATVRANGCPIEVVKDTSDEADYYSLVLVE